jgi:type I restriction enzyme, S subunit
MEVLEGWKKFKIREICEIGRGRVISAQEIEQHPGIFPVYSSQSTDNGKMGSIDTFDFDGEYVTWTTDGAYAGTVFLRSGKFNCTNVCGTLRAKESQVNMAFIAYKLSTLTKAHVSYVGNPKLMNGVMADIELTIPSSKHEQNQIAVICSTVDRAIGQTEALIAKQQRIKTGLMQDLLTRGIDEQGNIRSEQTHRFKDSPLGRIPVEWEIKQVNETGAVTLGRQLSPKYMAGKFPTPYLRVANVFDGWIDFSDVLEMDFTPSEKEKFFLISDDYF